MSILRAKNCVDRIEQALITDFSRTPTKSVNWRLDTNNLMISLLAQPNCMLNMFLANSKKCLGKDGDKANSNGKDEDKWLAVNIVFPGITVNADKNAPLLLQPHCSFFILLETKTKNGKPKALTEELPLNFWVMNQSWFDENHFVDVLFGYKEHRGNGKTAVVKRGDVAQMHYRPTRLFNVSEVGWLTDKVIEFIRMWCDV